MGLPVASLASDQKQTCTKRCIRELSSRKTSGTIDDRCRLSADVVDLPYVINTVPLEKESYLHRAGRVGRIRRNCRYDRSRPFVEGFEKIANQLSIELKEVYLHGGQLHTEAPVVEKKARKK